MMSASAVANGGGVAAGSVVAVCQSLAAGGISSAVSAGAGLAAAAGSTLLDED